MLNLGSLGNGDGSRVEEIDVSKAQEALVREFESILEVAAESNGAALGMVSCRLLAEVKQVGNVIGKGEPLHQFCGRLNADLLRYFLTRLCTDLLTYFPRRLCAELWRYFLRRLHRPIEVVPQDPLRRPIDVISQQSFRRLIEVVSQEALPDLHVDHLSQRSSLVPSIPSSSISYATRVHPLSLESEKAPPSDIKTLQQEVVFKILCSSDRVGVLLEREVQILRLFKVIQNPESQYSPAQKAVVLVFVRALEASIEKGLDSGSDKGLNVTARLVAPSCQISGGYLNVKDAIYHVTGRLRDNLFSTTLKSAEAKSSSSVLTETSPYERLLDTPPLGLQASSGVSHSLSRHTTLTMNSTNPLGLSHSLDHPHSPGLWTS
ncbi:hypothetical protein CRYUN_Cryun04dG0072100 [Craigia yunnanensis]